MSGGSCWVSLAACLQRHLPIKIERINQRNPTINEAGLDFCFGHALAASFQRFALECIPGRFASTFRRDLAETRANPTTLSPTHASNRPPESAYNQFLELALDRLLRPKPSLPERYSGSERPVHGMTLDRKFESPPFFRCCGFSNIHSFPDGFSGSTLGRNSPSGAPRR